MKAILLLLLYISVDLLVNQQKAISVHLLMNRRMPWCTTIRQSLFLNAP